MKIFVRIRMHALNISSYYLNINAFPFVLAQLHLYAQQSTAQSKVIVTNYSVSNDDLCFVYLFFYDYLYATVPRVCVYDVNATAADDVAADIYSSRSALISYSVCVYFFCFWSVLFQVILSRILLAILGFVDISTIFSVFFSSLCRQMQNHSVD